MEHACIHTHGMGLSLMQAQPDMQMASKITDVGFVVLRVTRLHEQECKVLII